jgi:hypothetical protein
MLSSAADGFVLNYFNYFTEIEEYFQTKREVFTRLSTLDWVLVENWKDQGIPLDCVFKGIDRAFSRPDAKRKIGSLAYCVKAVAAVCDEQKDFRIEQPVVPDVGSDEISRFVEKSANAVAGLSLTFPEFAGRFASIAKTIQELNITSLREVEQTLNAMEEKLVELLKIGCNETLLIDLKRSLDSELQPLRSKMTTEQLAMVEQQMWRRKLMEHFNVPRLSLFYLL